MTDSNNTGDSAGADFSPCAGSMWRVRMIESFCFGKSLDVGIGGEPVIVLHRGPSGWKTPDGMSHLRLSHQIYVRDLADATKHPTHEIAVVGMKTGKWVTVWARTDADVSYPSNKPVQPL